jgi:prepilin-type N-terminal cleavage/methylation domain-containing protein/prepilin-type processing-associated H-X9-DG protein
MNPPTAKEPRAFTFIELLVVIGVLAVLAGLVLPAFAAATREKSPRAQCMSNLRQLWLAVQIYGNENNDKPPQGNLTEHLLQSAFDSHAGGGIWDLPNGTVNNLLNARARRSLFYCPATQAGVLDGDFWWFYGAPLNAANQATAFGAYSTQTYFWMFDRGDTYMMLHTTRPVYSDNGGVANANYRRQLIKKLSVANTNLTIATTELAADTTVSEGNNRTTAKFVNVYSAASGSVIGGLQFLGYSSSHVQGSVPSGGNILFLDGHADWRHFSQMDWVVGWSNNRFFWF